MAEVNERMRVCCVCRGEAPVADLGSMERDPALGYFRQLPCCYPVDDAEATDHWVHEACLRRWESANILLKCPRCRAPLNSLELWEDGPIEGDNRAVFRYWDPCPTPPEATLEAEPEDWESEANAPPFVVLPHLRLLQPYFFDDGFDDLP